MQVHLVDISVEAVRRFEKEFLEYMAVKYPDVATTIAKDKDLSDATTAKLTAGIAEFKAQLAAANAELQPRLDAVAPAREAAVVAETARVAAAQEAHLFLIHHFCERIDEDFAPQDFAPRNP